MQNVPEDRLRKTSQYTMRLWRNIWTIVSAVKNVMHSNNTRDWDKVKRCSSRKLLIQPDYSRTLHWIRLTARNLFNRNGNTEDITTVLLVCSGYLRILISSDDIICSRWCWMRRLWIANEVCFSSWEKLMQFVFSEYLIDSLASLQYIIAILPIRLFHCTVKYVWTLEKMIRRMLKNKKYRKKSLQ